MSDNLIDLVAAFLDARRPLVALVSTCPEWSKETASSFHATRDNWLAENDAAVQRLAASEAIAARRLLLALLHRELKLDEEQRDVSAVNCVEILYRLFHDVLTCEHCNGTGQCPSNCGPNWPNPCCHCS